MKAEVGNERSLVLDLFRLTRPVDCVDVGLCSGGDQRRVVIEVALGRGVSEVLFRHVLGEIEDEPHHAAARLCNGLGVPLHAFGLRKPHP